MGDRHSLKFYEDLLFALYTFSRSKRGKSAFRNQARGLEASKRVKSAPRFTRALQRMEFGTGRPLDRQFLPRPAIVVCTAAVAKCLHASPDGKLRNRRQQMRCVDSESYVAGKSTGAIIRINRPLPA